MVSSRKNNRLGGKNITNELQPTLNLGDLLTSGDAGNGLEKVLKNIDKYGNAIDKIDKMLSRLERMKVIPTMVAAYAKKNDVQIPTIGIEPTSEVHSIVLKVVNSMPETDIPEVGKLLENFLKAKQKEDKV